MVTRMKQNERNSSKNGSNDDDKTWCHSREQGEENKVVDLVVVVVEVAIGAAIGVVVVAAAVVVAVVAVRVRREGEDTNAAND